MFSAYVEALDNMLDERRVEMTLRNFELTLLEELGVGVDFYHEADSEQLIRPHTWYFYRMHHGFVPVSQEMISSNINIEDVYRGSDLLEILERHFTSSSLKAAKRICRKNIQYLLNGREIMSRKLYIDYLESTDSHHYGK